MGDGRVKFLSLGLPVRAPINKGQFQHSTYFVFLTAQQQSDIFNVCGNEWA